MVGACIMVISIVKSMGPGLTNHLIDKALAIEGLAKLPTSNRSKLPLTPNETGF
jgi:hypothetical protein